MKYIAIVLLAFSQTVLAEGKITSTNEKQNLGSVTVTDAKVSAKCTLKGEGQTEDKVLTDGNCKNIFKSLFKTKKPAEPTNEPSSVKKD